MRDNMLFVTATDTGVGKTRLTAALAAWLYTRRPECRVSLWKPVQTGVLPGHPEADSCILHLAGGGRPREEEVASYTLPDPLAPWMAARRSGTSVDFARLVEEGRKKGRENDLLLAEGAGGLLVPLTEDKTVADLIRELDAPVVVVARPGLGTVNHTLLTLAYARQAGIRVRGVVLNGCREENRKQTEENRMMIETFSGIPVIGLLPWTESREEPEDWMKRREFLADLATRHIEQDRLPIVFRSHEK